MSFLLMNGPRLMDNPGWDVELTCSKCGFSGLPRYEGRSPNLGTGKGDVTIFAKVACPQCGHRLTEEAGRTLAELFENRDINGKNRSILAAFIAALIGIPAALAFVLFLGSQMGWWSWGLGSVWVLTASAIVIPLLVLFKNNRIRRLLQYCGCGGPHYVFMGTLDNAYCYRCFSCGNLLKLRE